MKNKMLVITLSALLATACSMQKPPTEGDIAVILMGKYGEEGYRATGKRFVVSDDKVKNLFCYETNDGPIWRCSYDFAIPYSRGKTTSLSINVRLRDDGFWVEVN